MTKLVKNKIEITKEPVLNVSLDNNRNIAAFPINSTFQTYRNNLYKSRYALHDFLRKDYFKHNVRYCGRPLESQIPLNIGESGKAHFQKIARCGNRWLCPVCAAKIASYKAEKLKEAMTGYFKSGYKIYFLTLTVRHNISDSLNQVLNKLISANRNFKMSHVWKNNVIEFYSTMEIRYSYFSGWHPHYHYAIICDRDKDIEQLKSDIINRYISFSDATISAQDIRPCHNSDDLANYISKNSLVHELTNTYSKNKGNSVNPIELLFIENKSYLFEEYMNETRGKNMNNKSRNFYQILNIEDVTDDEALIKGERLMMKMGEFDFIEYAYYRKENLLHDVLWLCDEQGLSVDDILQIIPPLIQKDKVKKKKIQEPVYNVDDSLNDSLKPNLEFYLENG